MSSRNGDAAEAGLRRYLRLIADLVGADLGAAWYELSPEVIAYLPLGTNSTRNDCSLALCWDEQRGWAVGLDTDDDFHVIACHHESVVPPPRVVATLARHTSSGDGSAASTDAAAHPDVSRTKTLQELAAYAPLPGEPS